MENAKVEISIGGSEDLRKVLDLSIQIFEPGEENLRKYHNFEDWEKKLRDDGVLIIARANGVMAGFIIAYRTGDEVMHVWNAGVLSEYRRMGIFSNMFEELSVYSKQNGVKKLTLFTIEQKFPEMYKAVINRGFVEYEKEWVEDEKVGKTEKSKFELSL